MTQSTFIDLHPNEYIEGFPYYPFEVNLDKCLGICNAMNDLSNKICVSNKRKDFNLSAFDMITEINESNTLTKHISCEWNVNASLIVANVARIKRITKISLWVENTE